MYNIVILCWTCNKMSFDCACIPQVSQLQNVISRNIRVCRTLPNRHDSTKGQCTTIHRMLRPHHVTLLQDVTHKTKGAITHTMYKTVRRSYTVIQCHTSMYDTVKGRCLFKDATPTMQDRVLGYHNLQNRTVLQDVTTYIVGPFYGMLQLKGRNCNGMSHSLCRIMLQDITSKVQNLVIGCHMLCRTVLFDDTPTL